MAGHPQLQQLAAISWQPRPLAKRASSPKAPPERLYNFEDPECLRRIFSLESIRLSLTNQIRALGAEVVCSELQRYGVFLDPENLVSKMAASLAELAAQYQSQVPDETIYAASPYQLIISLLTITGFVAVPLPDWVVKRDLNDLSRGENIRFGDYWEYPVQAHLPLPPYQDTEQTLGINAGSLTSFLQGLPASAIVYVQGSGDNQFLRKLQKKLPATFIGLANAINIDLLTQVLERHLHNPNDLELREMLEHLETQLRRELRLKEQYDPADLITLMRDPLPWLCKLLPDLTQEIVLSWGKFDGEARMVEAETRELLLGYAGFDPKKITIGAKGIIKPRLNINRLKSLAAKKRASRNLVRAAKSLEAFRLNIAADTKLDSYFAYQVCIMANLEYNEVPAELNLTVHDFIDQAIYSLRSSYYRIRSVTRKADHEPDAFSSWARPQEINPKTAQFLSEQFSRAFAGPIIKGEASDLELAAFLPRVPLNGFILGDFSVINSWLPKGSVDSVLSIKSLTFAPKRLLENLKETLRLLSPTGIAFLDLATSYRGDLPMNSISYLIRDVEFTDYNFYLIWGSDQPIVIATGSKVPRSTIEKFNPDLVDLKEGEKAEGSIVMLQIIEAVASRIQDVMGQNVFRKGCILRAIKNFTIIFLFNNAQVETTDIQRIADQVISSCALTMVLRDDD